MPTLLQINSIVNTGSTGRIVEQIGQFAMTKGWKSFIAFGRQSNESTSQTIKIGKEIDVILHGLLSRFLDKHGLGSIRATKALITYIQQINPSIIHLHNIHGYYINYPLLFEYLKKANIPVVWTLHDCWPITGHCSHFSDIDCVKWKLECYHCAKKKNYPTSLCIDQSQNNYKLKRHLFTSLNHMTIVPVSQWLKGIIQESFLSKYPMHVIRNGIDINAFHPLSDCSEIRKTYGIGDRYMLIGVAAAWGKGKGLNDYYTLSRILSDEYVIVLVGLAKRQIERLPTKIIGIERIENIQDLAKLYSTANIVLNLSYLETFGMTTVEGFACGTPGIVYKLTASPELVNQQTGIIVEPGNISLLVKAIETIASNGKEYYTVNCRKHAEQFFNSEDRSSEYFKLYNNLLAN